MPTDPRQPLAIHEASHAVAIHFLEPRGTLSHVTIIPDPERGRSGNATLRALAQPSQEAVVNRVVTQLAGAAAEAMWTGDEIGARAHSKVDEATVRQLLATIGPDLFEPLRTRAEEFAVERWSEINTVAAALLERQTLSGTEVANILRVDSADPLRSAGRGGRTMPLRLDDPSQDHRLYLGTPRVDEEELPSLHQLEADVRRVVGPAASARTVRLHTDALCGEREAFRQVYLDNLAKDVARERGDVRTDATEARIDSKTAALKQKLESEQAWRLPLEGRLDSEAAAPPRQVCGDAKAAFTRRLRETESEWRQPLSGRP
jgi:hypothetical protein